MINILLLSKTNKIKNLFHQVLGEENNGSFFLTSVSDVEDIGAKNSLEENKYHVVVIEDNNNKNKMLFNIFLIQHLFPDSSISVCQNGYLMPNNDLFAYGVQDIISTEETNPEELRRVLLNSYHRQKYISIRILKENSGTLARKIIDNASKQKIINLKKGQKEKLEDTGHEFRTSISLMSGAIDLLLEEIEGDKAIRLANMVQRSIRHLSELAELTLDNGNEKTESYKIKELVEIALTPKIFYT